MSDSIKKRDIVIEMLGLMSDENPRVPRDIFLNEDNINKYSSRLYTLGHILRDLVRLRTRKRQNESKTLQLNVNDEYVKTGAGESVLAYAYKEIRKKQILCNTIQSEFEPKFETFLSTIPNTYAKVISGDEIVICYIGIDWEATVLSVSDHSDELLKCVQKTYAQYGNKSKATVEIIDNIHNKIRERITNSNSMQKNILTYLKQMKGITQEIAKLEKIIENPLGI